MMSFIQQFYQDCLVKFALMGADPGIELAGSDKLRAAIQSIFSHKCYNFADQHNTII